MKKKKCISFDFSSGSYMDPEPDPLFHETDLDPDQNETDPRH